MLLRVLDPSELSAREAGFTLIELLVGLALLALLMPLLFGGLRLGLRAWQRVDVREGTEQIQLVQTFLRREIGGAYPTYVAGTGGVGWVEFGGHRERLDFVAPAPPQSAPGLVRMALTVEQEGATRRLVAAWRLDLPAAVGGEMPSIRSVLLSGIDEMEFAYFGSSRPGEAPRWFDGWRAAMAPRVVRVRARFPTGDPRIWPDLIVEPRVDVDAACVFDPVGRGCRGR